MSSKNTIIFGILLLLLATVFPVAADNTVALEPKSFESGLFTGSFETSYLIEASPGLGGMQPNLAFLYSSSSKDELGANRQPGVLGLGWSLRGANDRVMKVGPNQYNLILNGVRYDLVWTDDGYHTNPESYLKVTYGSDMWTVVGTDGAIYRLGQTDASRLKEAIKKTGAEFKNGEIQVWSLSEVENVNGLKMKYFYTKYTDPKDGHERSILPAGIEYNFDAGGNIIGNKKEIVFVYSPTESISDVYKTSGHWDDQKLTAIEVRLNGIPVRKYAMDYIYNSVTTSVGFKNPGFESGNLNNWQYWSSMRHIVKVERSGYSGYGVVMELKEYLGKVWIKQRVTIPRDAASMAYWVKINPWSLSDFDGLKVLVEGSNGKELADFYHAKNTDWNRRSVNLERWKGQTVNVWFESENTVGNDDPDETGKIYIDEILLGAGDTEKGYLFLSSIKEWGSDGSNFNGTLPIANFAYNGEKLLSRINNRFGGSQEISYQSFIPRTEFTGVYANDQARNRMISSTLNDGLGGVSTTRFAYANAGGTDTSLYHLEDGEFRGHGMVTITGPTGSKNIFRFNQDDEAKGMLESKEVLGNDGNKYGNKYSEVKNKIETKTTKINLPSDDQFNNPSFERNMLGWKTVYTGSGFAAASDEDSHDGSYSLKLTAGGASSSAIIPSGSIEARQTISLSQDVKWLSFYAKSITAPAGSGSGVFLRNGSGEYPIKSGISSEDWTEYKTDVSLWAGQEVAIVFRVYQSFENSPEIMLLIDDVSFLHRTNIIGNPFISETRVYTYSVNENAKMTLTTFARDNFGNIVDTTEFGEYDDAARQDVGFDKRQTATEYINDAVKNIIGVPKHAVISGYDINNEFVVQRESWMFYDDQELGSLIKGWLTKTKARKDRENNVSSEQGHDDYGNVNWTIDANRNLNPETGHTVDIIFDDVYHMYPVSSCNALNFCSTIGYDQLMRPINFTDINGQSTLIKLDNFGRQIAEARPGDTLEDPTSRTVFSDIADLLGNKPAFVQTIAKDGTIDGLVSFSLLDGSGNAVQKKAEGVNEGEWLVSDIYYCGDDCREVNSRGKLDRTSVPYTVVTSTPEVLNRKPRNEIGVWTVQRYDPIGRVSRIIKTDSTYTETVFGVWRTDLFDAMRHKSSAYDDGLGMTTRMENYLGNSSENYQLYATTLFKYNTGSGELVKLTDPAGNEQIMAFNLLGWKVWMNDSDLGNWSYGHDNNGNVIGQTDAKGQTIKFIVDVLNRVILKDYPTDYDTAYSFDGPNSKGYLYHVDGYSGGTGAAHVEKNFTRDERGRVINETIRIDGKEWTIGKSYNSLDWVVNTTYPDGEIVTARHNKAGAVDSPDGITPAIQSNLYGNYPYLEDVTFWQGKPESYIYGNGRITVREYNDREGRTDIFTGRAFTHQLLNLRTDGGVQNLQYGRDDNGGVRMVVDGINPDYSANYTQDDLARLIEAESVVFGILNFSYSNIGNIILKDGMPYIYPASGQGSVRPHAPISFGDKNYSYDANGNMAEDEKKSYSFEYNFDNYVEKIRSSCGIKGLYGYDESGVQAVTTGKQGTTYRIGGIYEEEWVNGRKEAVVKYYILGDATAIRRIDLAAGVNGLNFVHTDHLGSSSRVTDDDGLLSRSIGYTPYGGEAYSIGQTDIKHLFTGKEKDKNTGLYNYGARYYDPILAKFISPDPFEGPNRYEYVKSNPVNMVDPSGNFVVLAAAPYVIAALPTVTLSATAYLASNWDENIALGFTGGDIVSMAMPLPMPTKGKAAISAAEQIKKEFLLKYAAEKTSKDVVETVSKETGEALSKEVLETMAKKDPAYLEAHLFEESIKDLPENKQRIARAKRMSEQMDGTPYVEGQYNFLTDTYKEGLTKQEKLQLARKMNRPGP